MEQEQEFENERPTVRMAALAAWRLKVKNLLHRLARSKRPIGTKGPIMKEIKKLNAAEAAIGPSPTSMELTNIVRHIAEHDRKLADEHISTFITQATNWRGLPHPWVVDIKHEQTAQMIQNLVNWLHRNKKSIPELSEMLGTDMMTAVKLWDRYHPTVAQDNSIDTFLKKRREERELERAATPGTRRERERRVS